MSGQAPFATGEARPVKGRVVYVPTYRVSLVRDGSTQTDTRYVRTPEESARVLRACMDEDVDRESFSILMLDVRNKVIGYHVVSVGCLTQSLVHPREVFTVAILAKACAVVLCHNHPSGDPTPSAEDVAVTRRLRTAGTLLGIEVVDHIVLGDGTGAWVSMAQRGLM